MEESGAEAFVERFVAKKKLKREVEELLLIEEGDEDEFMSLFMTLDKSVEGIQDLDEMKKWVDGLKQAGLKTPAGKKRKIKLEEEMGMILKLDEKEFKGTEMEGLARVVGSTHEFLLLIVHAITQMRAEDNELVNRVALILKKEK